MIEFRSRNLICVSSVGEIKKYILIFFQMLNFRIILGIFMIKLRPRNLICISSVVEILKNIFIFFKSWLFG